MANHICKELNNLLKLAIDNGFTVILTHNIRITPPKHINAPLYIAHYGERAFHPVRRYLKNQCKVSWL